MCAANKSTGYFGRSSTVHSPGGETRWFVLYCSNWSFLEPGGLWIPHYLLVVGRPLNLLVLGRPASGPPHCLFFFFLGTRNSGIPGSGLRRLEPVPQLPPPKGTKPSAGLHCHLSSTAATRMIAASRKLSPGHQHHAMLHTRANHDGCLGAGGSERSLVSLLRPPPRHPQGPNGHRHWHDFWEVILYGYWRSS